MRATSTRAQFPTSKPAATRPDLATAFSTLTRMARNIWLGVREWCGDRAYDRYLQSQTGKCSDAALLSPEEFYVQQLNRRYSRPNRCC